ncbi:LuxR C-terminal-related transcriptional regulator [Ulvibacterium sp.]|uniref:LuxR C-terminal-related transcriptional regulator n=1 Tax=Ulvibacterium sp. TaxID=2665914 RepID=UPI003BA96F9F
MKSDTNPKIRQENLMQFADDTSAYLQDKIVDETSWKNLDEFPLLSKQALYVMNWKKKTIAYQRNIEKLLGYNDDEFDFQTALGMIHPNDIPVVSRVIKGTVHHYVHSKTVEPDSYLTLTYRFLKKDKSSIKLLRQTGAFEVSSQGEFISNWSLITAIDFISNNNQVEWHLNSNEIDFLKFKDNVYREFKDFFSARELLIIHGIKKGLKSLEIANELCISKHTVDTHRKNILRKCGCTNKDQLLNFCKRNGII